MSIDKTTAPCGPARPGRLDEGESGRAKGNIESPGAKKKLSQGASNGASPSNMAELRRTIENELARRQAHEASGGRERDLRLLRRRIAADLVGLANVCERRACRRSRRCRVERSPCLIAHRQAVIARFSVLLGYRAPARDADGVEEDLTW